MGTDDGKDISGEPLSMPPQNMLSLDVDIDMKVARIMAETWKDIDAIREGSETGSENSASTARAGNLSTVPRPTEPAMAERGTESEALEAGYVAELERLANGLHDIVDTSVPATDPVEIMLRDIRTEHASLAEAITRLRAAVAEVDACSDAFRRAMERYEAAGGEQMVLRETATPAPVERYEATGDEQMVLRETATRPPADPSHVDPPVTEKVSVDSSEAEVVIDRRAALEALRSLSI